jgi:hypothetical protein
VIKDASLNLVSAGILEQSTGTRNRLGIGLSYRSARLHRLEQSIPWNRFLDSLKYKNTNSELIEELIGPGVQSGRAPEIHLFILFFEGLYLSTDFSSYCISE